MAVVWSTICHWPHVLHRARSQGGINDRTYRIKHIGLCLFLLIFCQTKSDSQHRFTNYPVQLFFSEILYPPQLYLKRFILYVRSLDDSDVFYDNSGSRCAYQSNCHLFQSSDITETADLLVYKNKLCRILILKMMTSNKV